MTPPENHDIAIVGAGVVGLSIAWQLSMQEDAPRVVVVDRQKAGREASWAGAGILPPWKMEAAKHANEKLSALSFQMHPAWSIELQQVTGIDTGYRVDGALFLARTAGELGALNGQIFEWEERGVQVERLDKKALCELVPSIKPVADDVKLSVVLPEEAQLRNPHHLQALHAGCKQKGVTILEEQGGVRLRFEGARVQSIETESGNSIRADRVCVAAGAWSQELLEPIGVQLSTLPVRGQMLLYRLPQQTFRPIVYEGTRYIVPREDGHIVVGATLEEAGFDKSTTESGLQELQQFAHGLIEELGPEHLLRSWAGLRPASFDGFPYIGQEPSYENLFVATSHFRNGLLWSTGTAVLIAQLLQGQKPEFDITPFRIERG